MPSRFGVALVILFWLATTGFVLYRDVLPRYFSDGPPPIRIDLTDEATQRQAQWVIYRESADGQATKIGRLVTELDYVAADDTFWFRNQYYDLKLEFGAFGTNVLVALPKANSDVRVSRAGRLREQRMTAQLKVAVQFRGTPFARELGTANAELTARAVGDQLLGQVRIESDFGNEARELPPTPLSEGQVLSPMMPVARVRGVRPGQRWVIREVDPLKESIRALAKELAGKEKLLSALSSVSDGEPAELFAEVRSTPVMLTPLRIDPTGMSPEPVECWVIDYRGEGDVRAATWVGVRDGRVMRQEASGFGEKLRFERDF